MKLMFKSYVIYFIIFTPGSSVKRARFHDFHDFGTFWHYDIPCNIPFYSSSTSLSISDVVETTNAHSETATVTQTTHTLQQILIARHIHRQIQSQPFTHIERDTHTYSE